MGLRKQIYENKLPASLNDGLIAEYLFNDDVIDTSMYQNNLTLNGPVYGSDRFNTLNTALSFDGNSNATNDSLSGMTFNSVDCFSFSFWVYIGETFITDNRVFSYLIGTLGTISVRLNS